MKCGVLYPMLLEVTQTLNLLILYTQRWKWH